jgi:hypothetical protein
LVVPELVDGIDTIAVAEGGQTYVAGGATLGLVESNGTIGWTKSLAQGGLVQTIDEIDLVGDFLYLGGGLGFFLARTDHLGAISCD